VAPPRRLVRFPPKAGHNPPPRPPRAPARRPVRFPAGQGAGLPFPDAAELTAGGDRCAPRPGPEGPGYPLPSPGGTSMPQQTTPSYRPLLESLEERALPNNVFGNGHGPFDKDGDANSLWAVAAASDAATQEKNNPQVAPVQSNTNGASYGEWSARWWQYALS